MIDLIKFTDNAGDPVFINPAVVRSVEPLPMGNAVVSFGDDGEFSHYVVEEPWEEVITLLTGKPPEKTENERARRNELGMRIAVRPAKPGHA